MPRTLLSIPLLLAVLIAAAACYGGANPQPVNGEHDPDGDGLIEVEFLEQLDAIRYDLDGDGKADDDSNVDAYASAFAGTVCDNSCNGYELVRSLDFAAHDSYASGAVRAEWTTGEGWQPIQSGDAWVLVAEYPFAAIFDGNGNTISNLYINGPDNPQHSAPAGLFGSASDSIIRNVGLVGVHVVGFVSVGGLAGTNLGHIEDSYVTGSVAGFGYVGGLAGFADSSSEISGSHFSGTVTARATDGQAVGGLVGHQSGVIRASYASGSVSGNENVGGLAGENDGGANIVASYSSAEVSGNRGVGGLAGTNRFLISGSYATGNVTGGSGVGGLAGYNGTLGMIVASYATGTVTGDVGAGGLTGWNTGDIVASYATGDVSGNENVGGLTGGNTEKADITASYATGRVSGGDNAGGVIGFNTANVTDAVWDTETSGIRNGVGGGNSQGVTGKTTVELQAAVGYAGAYRDWEIYFTYSDGRYFRYLENVPGPYDFWDFGTSGQYPALKAYLGFHDITGWWDTPGQPRDARQPAPTTVPVVAISPALVRYDSDGDGLIEISNLDQLNAIRYDLDGDGIPEDASKDKFNAAYPVSGEEVVCNNNCGGYELARPLDFADAGSYASGAINDAWTTDDGWQPIGDKDGYGGRFNALFDGNGHVIANLYVNDTAPSEEPLAVGLFGYAGYSAVIRNTGIVNASVAGLEYVGGLAGRSLGEIKDSWVTGSVSVGHHHAGGLVGENGGAIIGSRAAVSMSCADYGDSVGGLVGDNIGEIRDSFAAGSVACVNNNFIGGLTGRNWGTISGSYANGDIVGDSNVGGLTGTLGFDGMIIASYANGDVTGRYGIGGLAGGSSGFIRGSYATGRVKGGSKAGGLAGENAGTIIASYATGLVSGGSEVGGLAGSNNFGTVIASYATGSVSGDEYVGGLAGESHHSTVVASYAAGAVSGGGVETGGLIGARSGTIRESVSFWDTQTTGQETSASGAGKTTAELQSPTASNGIYENWQTDLDDTDGDHDPATGVDDFWDFGTRSEYPALKFDVDGDGTPTWQEFGGQIRTPLTVKPVPNATPPVEDNCLETVTADGVISGAWSSACLSFNRPGSYARFYAFTLDTDSEVFITLESDDTNTYLYVQRGAGTTSKSFRSQGSPDRYSRIEDGFSAGTYTIESATYEAGQSGTFTLTISGLGGTVAATPSVSSRSIYGLGPGNRFVVDCGNWA